MTYDSAILGNKNQMYQCRMLDTSVDNSTFKKKEYEITVECNCTQVSSVMRLQQRQF